MKDGVLTDGSRHHRGRDPRDRFRNDYGGDIQGAPTLQEQGH